MSPESEGLKQFLLKNPTEDEIRKNYPDKKIESLRRLQRKYRQHEIQSTNLTEDLHKQKNIPFNKDLRYRYDAALKKIIEQEKNIQTLLDIQKELPRHIEIKPDNKNSTSESTAVIVASDWHIEETVDKKKVNGLNEFNLEIADYRIKKFFENALKLIKISQHESKINTVVFALLGDFFSSNIHEELLENTSLRPVEAVLKVQDYLYNGINFLLNQTKVNLVVPCSVGNHSRITRQVHVSTENGNSLEFFMYCNLAKLFKNEKRVTFQISDGYHNYMNIYNLNVRFHHGHNVRYGGGIGGVTIPMKKAIAGWNRGKRTDLDVLGHYHQFIDGGSFLMNGSLVGYNSYALSLKCEFEPPRQSFFLVHPRYGKTITAPIILQ